MDFKYKHFYKERTWPDPREEVLNATRRFFIESLGWQVTETADGIRADGSSFAHSATAICHIDAASNGTRLLIELSVERASPLGFMLFDVGGYFNIQLRKWFDSIEWLLGQNRNPVAAGHSAPPMPDFSPYKRCAIVFKGCLAFIGVMFALYFLVTVISAVIGLITGNLFLIGRGATFTVHGIWARLLSGLILAFGIVIVLRLATKRKRTPAILRPR